MIKLIVAYDKNKLIGNNNKMPWHIKEELAHFRDTTINSTLLMGRKTFQGLPCVLKDRKITVLSTGEVPGADIVLHNDEELINYLAQYKDSDEVLWIAGGKNIYEKYYNEASELWISEVHGEFEGNINLNIDLNNWKRIKLKEYNEFTVYKYTKQ